MASASGNAKSEVHRAIEVFIAPDGDDRNPGTKEEPLASLERARDIIRENKLDPESFLSGFDVVLRGGTYHRSSPLVLNVRDSGRPGKPTTWRPASGESVRVTGGEILDPSWFAPLAPADPVRDLFVNPSAGDAVLVVDLSAHGITDYGALVRRGYDAEGAVAALELFIDGEAMELARWPNRGQNDPFDPEGDAVVVGDIFSDGTVFRYLGTSAQGNADDGYPNYHADLGGGEHAYLYHCTWGDGGQHKYWFVSPYDPISNADCWPTDTRSWGSYGTDLIPVLEPLAGGSENDLIVHDKPKGTAEDGFVLTPDTISVAVVDGALSPDVAGTFFQVGEIEGWPYYERNGLVGGLQFYLYARSTDPDFQQWTLSPTPGANPNGGEPSWTQTGNCYQCFGTLGPAGGSATGTTQPWSETWFGFPGQRHAQWAAADDLWFQGLFGVLWADDTLPGAIDSEARVRLGAEPSYGTKPRQPFAVVNILEEIDQPGEWFVDRSNGKLYLWPPHPLDGAEIVVSMTDQPLLESNGASHLRFDGLVFEAGRGDLVIVDDADDVVFERCTFRNSGAAAVRIRGLNSGLERCTVANAGGRAVRIEGGIRPSLTPGNNFVRNSHIHHFGRWERTYREGVRLYGCGNVVEHNSIHDAPHSAILFFGNEHVIEYNEIEGVVQEANDAGAIYAGRDWGYRGNRIRFNFFNRIDSIFGGSHGVYLDDAASGMEVFGNIFYDVNGRATLSGGGRDNHFANNVIVNCEGGHSTDRRARTSNNSFGYLGRPNSWNLLGRVNVVYETYYSDYPDVQTIAYQAPPWSTAYPTLAAMPNDWAQVESSHWQDPEGCVFSRSITWQSAPMLRESSWGGSGALGFYLVENNIEEQDPLFVDEAGGDFNLRPDSPAFTIPGFVAIPFDEIGIQPDPLDIFADDFELGNTGHWSVTVP